MLGLLRSLLGIPRRSTPLLTRSATTSLMSTTIKVSVADGDLMEALNRIAPVPETEGMTSLEGDEEKGLILQRSEDGTGALELAWGRDANVKESPFRIDFAAKNMQRRFKDCRSELVVKAVGKPDVVFDFTAGLGRDASLCAAAGTPVILFERNWVLFQLLRDAVTRLSETSPELAGRMSVFHLDSGTSSVEEMEGVMLQHLGAADSRRSVYLDPMYPPDKIGRKSAVKKETQMLHRIIGQSLGGQQEEQNESAMLTRALKLATDRVIVKRPLKSDSLSADEVDSPSASVTGSTHRFDIYTPSS